MQKEISFDTIREFIDNLKSMGITKIAFTEIDEKRAFEITPGQLAISRYSLLELLAYRDSTIYKFISKEPDFTSIHNLLLSEGFEIKRRSRNIT
jgi:hypothetical protein